MQLLSSLLRTLEHSHVIDDPVSEENFLIPCCGFSRYENDGSFDLMVMGCNMGLNPEIQHEGHQVNIIFNGENKQVTKIEWVGAVTNFAKDVLCFYESCNPKIKPLDDYEQKCLNLFWSEFFEQIDRAQSYLKQVIKSP